MNSEIRKLLESVQAGKTSVDDAMLELKKAPFEDIGYAKVDLHRKVRQGAAEVIYGAGKTPEQIGGIIDAMRANGQTRVLITRMSPEAAAYVGSTRELDYHKDARVGIVGGLPQPDGIGKVVIATGGGSLLDRENTRALKRTGTLYWITRPLESLATDGRPLSKGGIATLKKLYNERKDIYAAAADEILENKTIDSTAEEILRRNVTKK